MDDRKRKPQSTEALNKLLSSLRKWAAQSSPAADAADLDAKLKRAAPALAWLISGGLLTFLDARARPERANLAAKWAQYQQYLDDAHRKYPKARKVSSSGVDMS
jgi:hypothetical protein